MNAAHLIVVIGFAFCVALSAAGAASAKRQASSVAPGDPGPSPTLGAKPPAMDDRSVILFDGRDFSRFTTKDRQPSEFKIDASKGIAIAAGGDTVSKESFSDFQLHIEFLCPVSDKDGQAKSNSGVYLHGRYEIQVLDTFGQPPADNFCGGIYKIATPLVSASRPAGQWQTFDVTFRAPRFNDAGQVKENPRVTVLHNGIVIHNNVELPSTTAGGIDQVMVKEGPLLLQDHGDPVEYRNIWVRRL
jgi:hypothetical protein